MPWLTRCKSARGLRKTPRRRSGDLIAQGDEARRSHVARLQEAQERRNAASKEIGKAMAAKEAALAYRLKAEITELKSFVQNGEAEERRLDQALNDALAVISMRPARRCTGRC